LSILSVAAIMTTTSLHAQLKVGDNPTTINANSALEIESNNKGLLLPRVPLTALDNPAPLTSHIAGMQVYNTTDNGSIDLMPGIYYNDGTKWLRSSTVLERSLIQGNGAPSGPCSNAGEMYTDTTESSTSYGKVWICSGGIWVESTTSTPTKNTTPFYLGKSKIDAEGKKNGMIRRPGTIVVAPEYHPGDFANGTVSGPGGIELYLGGNDARLSVQRNSPNPNLILTKKGTATGFKFLEFRVDGDNIGYFSRDNGTLTFNVPSDERLKENVRSTSYSIEDLMKIKVKEYNYISDSTQSKAVGFLAQELHKVFPEAVSVGGEDIKENPWTVDYSKLTPLLVKAIQDQQQEIESLKSTLNERLAQLEHNANKKKDRLSKRVSKKKTEAKLAIN